MRATKFLLMVTATIVLSGCASTAMKINNSMISRENAPFYLAYESPVVILDQAKVATITSVNGLVVDGVTANARNMRSANAGALKVTTAVVDVMPGEHRVEITYVGGNSVSMEPITYNFEAGKIYMLTPGISNVYVTENTDQAVAEKIAANRSNAVFKNKR